MISKQINKILKEGKLTCANKECMYYPCHDSDEIDCTFCFCPFYPCDDRLTGGEMVTTEESVVVWGCKKCVWIHRPEIAQKILNEILKLNVNKIEEVDREKLVVIRRKCLK